MDETKQKRKRGGQPGNTSAVKSGLYSHAFDKLELDGLSTIDGTLDDEIALLRVVTRRAFEFANKHEPSDLEGWMKLLNTMGVVNVKIAALLRTKLLLEGRGDSSDSMISQALAEVMKGFGYGQ